MEWLRFNVIVILGNFEIGNEFKEFAHCHHLDVLAILFKGHLFSQRNVLLTVEAEYFFQVFLSLDRKKTISCILVRKSTSIFVFRNQTHLRSLLSTSAIAKSRTCINYLKPFCWNSFIHLINGRQNLWTSLCLKPSLVGIRSLLNCSIVSLLYGYTS